MIDNLLKLIAASSTYFAHRKGLLPLVGIGLILFNLLLATILPADWLIIKNNFFLHIGLVVAIVGFLLARAL